jgi:hypothetical protein
MVTPLRDILKSVTQAWRLEPAARLALAQAAWPRMVGKSLAEVSAPVGIHGRRLVIGVIHPTVGQEIRLRRTAIIQSLARELGENAVTELVPAARRRLPARRSGKPQRTGG